MLVQPYLSFEGRCEEALEFYKSALGAEVQMLMRFKDNPDLKGCESDPKMMPPGAENKVMHAALRIGDSLIMGSDGYCSGKANFQGISLALTAKNESEADRFFKALSNGGNVQMPLTKTFFSPAFGMVTDRFGVSWMVVVEQEQK